MAEHHVFIGVTRQSRDLKDEFQVDLYYLVKGDSRLDQHYFSYATSFGTFLSDLRGATGWYKAGFTLEDGPWQYNVVEDCKTSAEKKWSDLIDEASFEVMLQKLKKTTGRVIIMHVKSTHHL